MKKALRRLSATVAMSMLAAVIVASCSGGGAAEQSTAEPVFEPSSAPAASGAPGGPTTAPPIPQQLDVSGFLDRPCTVLDDATIRAIGAVPPGELDTGSNPGCVWQDGNGPETSFAFNDDNPGGLDDFYKARALQNRKYFGYFEPTTITGYPGAFNDATDGRQNGFCALAVGINDNMTLTVAQQGGDGFTSCDMVKRAAEGIVATLQDAQ